MADEKSRDLGFSFIRRTYYILNRIYRTSDLGGENDCFLRPENSLRRYFLNASTRDSVAGFPVKIILSASCTRRFTILQPNSLRGPRGFLVHFLRSVINIRPHWSRQSEFEMFDKMAFQKISQKVRTGWEDGKVLPNK